MTVMRATLAFIGLARQKYGSKLRQVWSILYRAVLQFHHKGTEAQDDCKATVLGACHSERSEESLLR